ncbi:MAG TPA: DUF86 domain-containing protein, partial [Vicinamibacterales bacterium]|nr:DUF86 domain-containing protein [Vicinamibacterales bacterium]
SLCRRGRTLAPSAYCTRPRNCEARISSRPCGRSPEGILIPPDGMAWVRQQELHEFEGIPLEGFVSEWRTSSIVERALEVAIGVSIDLMRHTLSRHGLGLPTTYRGVVFAARDAGLLEAGLAASLADLCRFRHVPAHEGDRIDDAVVVDVLHHGVRNLRRFREAASGW